MEASCITKKEYMKMKKYIENRWLIYLSALIILITLAAGLGFSHIEEKIGENPIRGMNTVYSKVLMSGKGYTMDQNLKKEVEKQKEKKQTEDKVSKELEKGQESKKENSENQAGKREESEVDDDKSTNENQNLEDEQESDDEEFTGDDQDVEDDEYVEEDIEEDKEDDESLDDDDFDEPAPPYEDKSPTIITDLADIRSVDGTRLTFNVEAVDYKGRSIERGNFKVYVNDVITYSSGTVYKGKYQPELQEGENRIVIQVTDAYGNSVSKVYMVDCNPEGEAEVGGSVRVVIDARTVGLGYILDTEQDFYVGDSVSHVVMKALDDNGFSYVARGNGSYGWYLAEISKAGMMSEEDVNIPQPIQEKLDEEGASYMGFDSSDVDRLREKSLYENSGWIYKYNEEFLDTGMSNSDAQDGDVITLAFTLHMGYEYNGRWFYGSW